MKTISVIISGLPQGENIRELEIQPGTSACDLTRALNLEGYLISKENSSQKFANEEESYPVVEDGAKLRATPIAEVGR